MAINERLVHTASATAAAAGTGNQEEGLILHLDANDVDSYDGDGDVWYDITNHEYTPNTDVSEHFNTVTYAGTGATNPITVGFQPDLIWIKNRDQTDSHAIVDSVRGITSPAPYLTSDLNSAEATSTNMPTSVQSDGFTITGSGGRTNTSGEDYVAWCFKAGGAPSGSDKVSIDGTSYSTMSEASLTDGTISIDKLSVNTNLGFSIVSYNGNQVPNATVAHGLGVKPELIIVKNLQAPVSWGVWTTGISDSQVLRLDQTAAATTPATAYFEPQNNTGNVFSLGTNDETNHNDDYIAYCFASKRGVSKVGSYTGTGASGNKIYTGFEPAFVMVKLYSNTSGSGHWAMFDNARGAEPPMLRANTTDSEFAGDRIDFNADGFTLKDADAGRNYSGYKYIYLAFAAEKPDSLVTSTEGSIDSNSVSSIALSSTSSVAPTIDGGIRDVFGGSLVVSEQFGFGDTGNSEGTNYFTLTLNEATAFKKFAVHEMYQSTYKYTGTVKVYGSNDNSYFTLIAQTNQTTSVQFNRNETDISDTTEYLYYKFDFYGNTRGTYQGAFRIELITDLDVTPELHLDAASYSGSGYTWTADTGNDATINGAAYDQELGDWFDFDGVNDFVLPSHTPYQSTGALTMAAWINPDSVTQLQGVLSLRGSSSNSVKFLLVVNSDNALRLDSSSTSGFITLASGNTNHTLSVNKWHHIAATIDYSSKQFALYLDGNLVSSGTNSSIRSASTFNVDKFYIGTNYNGQFFNGKIGQVRVYSSALTGTQVRQNFNFTKNDYPNGGDGTITGASFTPAAGSDPDYFSFDGSNDYIELDYIHPTVPKTTANFWIKFADVTPSQNGYFASSTASGGSNANNNFHLGLLTTGRLYAEYGSQWNYLTASASESDLTANTWTMLSFVWSDSSIKYYKNGELKTTTTGFSNIGTTNNNVKLHLGRMGAYNGYYVDMDLGQFKIYDKELTADELVAEFNKHKADYGL